MFFLLFGGDNFLKKALDNFLINLIILIIGIDISNIWYGHNLLQVILRGQQYIIQIWVNIEQFASGWGQAS